jgi:hypothetical protein
MRHLLTCALLALGAAAQAALPTSGLPNSEHPLVIHVSLEAADKTKVGKVMLDEIDRQSKADPNAKRQFDLMGIADIRDIRDVTLLMTPGDGAESRVVGLLRGKFDKARIEAFAAEKKVASRTVAGLRAWSANGLDAALGVLGNQPAPGDQYYLLVADDTTLVVADEASLLGAAEALKANKPWKQADLAGSLAAVSGGWMAARVDVLAAEAAEAAKADPSQPAEQPSGAKTFTLAAGENASDIQLRGDMTFVSAQKATEAVTQAKGLLGFAQLGLMPSPEDTPEDAAKKADLLAVVQRLKLEQAGDRASLDIAFPAAKAAELVRKQIAEGQLGR